MVSLKLIRQNDFCNNSLQKRTERKVSVEFLHQNIRHPLQSLMKKKNVSPNSFEWSNWKTVQWSCSTNENLSNKRRRELLHNEEIYLIFARSLVMICLLKSIELNSLSCQYEHRTLIIEVRVQRRDLISRFQRWNQNKLSKYFFSNGNEKHLINSRQINSMSTLAQAEALSLNTSLIWTNLLCKLRLFSNESIGSKCIKKKNIFTIVEWWDLFVWEIKFSRLIASSSRPDSIVFCHFSFTCRRKIPLKQIEFDKVTKCRSFSPPTVDMEILHQTVEMMLKGNFFRMSTMKKLLEENRWSSLYFHRWFVVGKRRTFLLHKSFQIHQSGWEIVDRLSKWNFNVFRFTFVDLHWRSTRWERSLIVLDFCQRGTNSVSMRRTIDSIFTLLLRTSSSKFNKKFSFFSSLNVQMFHLKEGTNRRTKFSLQWNFQSFVDKQKKNAPREIEETVEFFSLK